MRTLYSIIQLFLVYGMSLFLSCDQTNPLDSDAPFEAGPILFVSDKSGTWQLWSMNEDGSNVRELTHDPAFWIIDARWSPDGSKIVFTSRDDRLSPRDRGAALYVMNADGTGGYKLTNPPLGESWDVNPRWSPDGKKIAFSRSRAGAEDIFIIDIEGKTERNVTRNPRLTQFPAGWTPDGRHLLVSTFSNSEGNGRIAFIDLEGNHVQRLTPEEADDNAPVLSPDGQSIAFSSIGIRNSITGRFLHLMDSDGSNRRQLSISLRQYEYPVEWPPDGQRILCMTHDPNKKSDPNDPYSNFPQDILIVNVADGSVRTVTPFPHREAYSRATSWRRR
jgi:Tol biopolymer transport system component